MQNLQIRLSPATDAKTRLHGFDGLRAIAITIVLVAHALGTKNFLPFVHTPFVGDMGVRAFFVISGFLITGLLIGEKEKRGRISLRTFYARRCYRILPAFCAYLVVMVLARAAGWIDLPRADIVYAASFTMNMNPDRCWWLGHFWSLAVEEQFYLLWPIMLAFLSRRAVLLIAACASLSGPFLRVGAWLFLPASRDLIDQAFPFVLDSLAAGCLLALVRDRLEASPRYAALLGSRWFWAVPIACLAAFSIPHNAWGLVGGITLGNLGFALMIHRCVRHPAKPFGRLLAARPLVFLGTLSYSLYLWQQPFLNRHEVGFIHTFPFHFVLVFACALGSFYLIEKPMLLLGARRAARKRAMRQAAAPMLAPA